MTALARGEGTQGKMMTQLGRTVDGRAWESLGGVMGATPEGSTVATPQRDGPGHG